MAETKYTLANYAEFVADTCKTPVGEERHVAFLGLVGEVGEFVDAIYRGVDNALLMKEAGDVLWYINALANAYGYTLTEVHNPYKPRYDRKDNLSFLQEVLAQLAEMLKKNITYDVKPFDDEDVMMQIEALRHELLLCLGRYREDLTYGVVVEANIAKLSERKKKGSLVSKKGR